MTDFFYVSHDDRREVPDFAGLAVAQILIDDQFELRAGPNRVVLRQGFELTLDGETTLADPALRRGLCPAIELFGLVFRTVSAFKDGRLSVSFIGGGEIRVARHDEGEAWRIETGRGGLIIAVGGGTTTRGS